MKIISSQTPSNKQVLAIFRLWNQEYPASLSHVDLTSLISYLDKLEQPNHYFLINEYEQINGWAFTFNRENARWFATIVDGKIQRQGYGSQLLDLLKSDETVLNGWVIDHNGDLKSDGTPYVSPLAFYLKNDFQLQSEIRLELPVISAVKISWVRS